VLERRFQMVVCLALVSALVAGCAPVGPAAQADVAKSDKQRAAALAPEQAGVPELVQGNTAFALDLYRALFAARANQFSSPYSVSLALAMTYAGARGDTERQMAQALHFTLAQEKLHAAFNALEAELARRGEGKEAEAFRLKIANALWAQKGYQFLPAYLDLLAQNYGAGVRLADFVKAAEEWRQAINRWVSEQTEEKVKDLLPPGSIDSVTRLVLSNAIYFKAAWQKPFSADQTADAAFYTLDGKSVQVPMMAQTESLAYGEGPGFQAVELPYAGGQLSMLILLPASGEFERLAQGLNAAQLAGILSGMREHRVQLSMPRFRFESSFQLKPALQGLGMTDAFGAAADLSGMDGSRDLFVSDAYHKAFVAVDEKGTEAAAATAVVISLKAAPMPQETVEMRLERPFLFLIRDIPTGAVLFAGHVVNPLAGS